MAAFLVLCACLTGFAFFLRCLVSLHYPRAGFAASLAPLACLAVLPAFFKYVNYLYDPGTLFTFTGAILFIRMRNRPAFYCFFILAAFNKETAILLVLLFALEEHDRLSGRAIASHVLVQGAVFASIKVYLTWVFRGNGGSSWSST